jgi:uncharacterized protein
MISFSEKNGTVTFAVRVVPRASRSEIVGEYDGALRVRLAARPVDGAANEELVRIISRALCVQRSRIGIVSGQSSRIKKLRVTGIGSEALQKLVETN